MCLFIDFLKRWKRKFRVWTSLSALPRPIIFMASGGFPHKSPLSKEGFPKVGSFKLLLKVQWSVWILRIFGRKHTPGTPLTTEQRFKSLPWDTIMDSWAKLSYSWPLPIQVPLIWADSAAYYSSKTTWKNPVGLNKACKTWQPFLPLF